MVTKLIGIALLAMLGISLSACSGHMSINEDYSESGSEVGIRAHNDGLVGIARTAKEDPEKENEYLGFRRTQENEVTQRVNRSKSFLQKMFSDDAPKKHQDDPSSGS